MEGERSGQVYVSESKGAGEDVCISMSFKMKQFYSKVHSWSDLHCVDWPCDLWSNQLNNGACASIKQEYSAMTCVYCKWTGACNKLMNVSN